MSKKLWEASQTKKKYSNLYKYEKFLSKKYNLNIKQNYFTNIKLNRVILY